MRNELLYDDPELLARCKAITREDFPGLAVLYHEDDQVNNVNNLVEHFNGPKILAGAAQVTLVDALGFRFSGAADASLESAWPVLTDVQDLVIYSVGYPIAGAASLGYAMGTTTTPGVGANNNGTSFWTELGATDDATTGGTLVGTVNGVYCCNIAVYRTDGTSARFYGNANGTVVAEANNNVTGDLSVIPNRVLSQAVSGAFQSSNGLAKYSHMGAFFLTARVPNSLLLAAARWMGQVVYKGHMYPGLIGLPGNL